MSEPPYDCQQCGACCADHGSLGGDGYVWLNRAESKRMKRMGLSVVQESGDSFLGTRAPLGGSAPTCVALQGQIGGDCQCSVYLQRPKNCRAYLVGGNQCRAARREAGLPI